MDNTLPPPTASSPPVIEVLDSEVTQQTPIQLSAAGRPAESTELWGRFIRLSRNRVQCQVVNAVGKICGKETVANTTNLRRHLKASHGSVFTEVDKADSNNRKQRQLAKEDTAGPSKKKTKTLQEVWNDAKKWSKDNPLQVEANKQLAILINSSSLPFCLVQDPHFQQFCHTLRAQYTVPGYRALKSESRNQCAILRSSISEALTHCRRVCICADIWTKSNMTASYLGITAHFYDPNSHKKETALLGIRRMHDRHTGDYIRELTNEVIDEWNIPKTKLFHAVTDNGANVVKGYNDYAAKYIQPVIVDAPSEETATIEEVSIPRTHIYAVDPNIDEEEDEDVTTVLDEIADYESREEEHNIAFEPTFRLSCFIHTLMCSLRGKFDGVESDLLDLKKKVFRLVKKFSKSHEAMRRLLHLTNNLGLVTASKTRWNTAVYVFKRLVRLESHISQVCTDLRWNDVKLTPPEWRKLKKLTSLLEPFAKHTTLMEGDNYVTISTVYSTVKELELQLHVSEIDPDVGNLATDLLADLKRRFKYIKDPSCANFEPTFLVAASIDPKFSWLLDAELREQAQKIVRDMLKSQTNDEHEEMVDSEETTIPTEMQQFSLVYKAAMEQQQNVSNDIMAKLDAEVTLAYKDILVSRSVNCLEYWAKKSEVFPNLSKLALDILCIPSTSAPIERVFSQAGLVLGDRRTTLTDEQFENEVLFRVNETFLS